MINKHKKKNLKNSFTKITFQNQTWPAGEMAQRPQGLLTRRLAI